MDGIGEKLVGMIDPAELIEEVRGYGIRIEWDGMLAGEMEEMD